MSYVYFLKKSKSKYIYIGFTNDLQKRTKQHKKDKPDYKLIYYEAYLSENDARKRERQLKKYGSGLGHLKTRLFNSLIKI
ncbi:MAG TPA: GIY-YIG nuclease family protein [bacterium]|nr:GIY-YIG nuclease family protein [bacterium]